MSDTTQEMVNCKSCGHITAVDPVDCRCLSCGEEVCLYCGCTSNRRCFAGLDEHEGCYRVRKGVCSGCVPSDQMRCERCLGLFTPKGIETRCDLCRNRE